MNVVPRDLMTEIPVSSADFRGAMRHLTGGVSVITAGRGKDVTGMTVTSVASLSVDPPTLLVSINRDASSFPLIRRYGAFGVNILNADQLDVADIERQVAWFKAQKLIDDGVEPRNIVDMGLGTTP